MANFTIENRLGLIKDIARSWLYELIIPDIKTVTNNVIDQEGLIVRVKSAVIPGRSIELIESVYLGMKQLFPGKPSFTNSLALSIDETEDQIVLKAINEWQQNIFDIDNLSPTGGYSKKPNKRSMTTKVILRMYAYNGVKLPNDFVMYNCFPSSRDDITLSMESNDKVQVPLTLSFDFWKLEPSK
jgi:hypothetical protein